MQFLPKYACWLNLIEPWWKQVRSLPLKGRRFETLDELVAVFEDRKGIHLDLEEARLDQQKEDPERLRMFRK